LEYLAREEDYAVGWDMEDGFYMLGVKREFRRFFQFMLDGRHVDVLGPIRTPGVKGRRYNIGCIDDCTRFKKYYKIENKGQAGKKLQTFITEMGKPSCSRCDNAKEFV
jgi:hypothetical protein